MDRDFPRTRSSLDLSAKPRASVASAKRPQPEGNSILIRCAREEGLEALQRKRRLAGFDHGRTALRPTWQERAEIRLRLVASDGPSATWRYDAIDREADYSAGFAEMLDLSPGEAPGVIADMLAALARGETVAGTAPGGAPIAEADAFLATQSADPRWFRIRAFQEGGEEPGSERLLGSIHPLSAEEVHADFTRAVAESLESRVCVLDREGRIVYSNNAWQENLRRYDTAAEVAGPGVSYLEVCERSAAEGDAIAADVLAGLEEVLAGRREDFRLDYPCSDGIEDRWFEVRVQQARGALGWVVVRHDEITDRKRLEMALAREAHYDRSTGLPNRSFLVGSLLDSAGKDGERQAVRLFHVGVHELDGIVRRFGRRVADSVERGLGQRIAEAATGEASVAALGQGEFLVARREALSESEAQAYAESLRRIASAPILASQVDVHLDASVGIACAGPGPGNAAVEKLLRSAEVAFLEAQRQAGGSTRAFDREMARKRAQTLRRQHRARLSLADKSFELVFQPIVGSVNPYPAAIETLLRRRRRDGTLESMGETLLHLERSSSLIEIDRWTMETACRQWVAWRAAKGCDWPFGCITVNTSPFHFQQPDFVPWLKQMLIQTRMPPGRLALEVTERAYIDDEDAFSRSIEGVAMLGVSVWVDDFGTGYSSFELLRKGWANAVKLDRAMASPERYDHFTRSVIRAIVSLARHLGLRTIAEGVETPHQALELGRLKCDLQQGFYHAHPMTAPDLESWVRQRITEAA